MIKQALKGNFNRCEMANCTRSNLLTTIPHVIWYRFNATSHSQVGMRVVMLASVNFLQR